MRRSLIALMLVALVFGACGVDDEDQPSLGEGSLVYRGDSHGAMFAVATLTDSSGSDPILSDEDVICIGEVSKGEHPVESTLNAYHNAVLVGTSPGSHFPQRVVVPSSQTSPGDEVYCEVIASETLSPFFRVSHTTEPKVVRP